MSFIYVGRLEEPKGVRTLFEAWKRMGDDAPDLTGVPKELADLMCADRVTPDGRLTQFMATSVWEAERQATVQPRHTTPGGYANIPQKAKDYDADDARALFGEYRPHLERFFHAGLQGRCRLEVSDEAVKMTVFGGDSAEPSRTFALRNSAAGLV